MRHGGFSNYSPPALHGAVGYLYDESGLFITSEHHYPVEGFVHYLDDVGSCSCGPHIIVVNRSGHGDTPVIHHVAFGIGLIPALIGAAEFENPDIDDDDDDGFDELVFHSGT